MLIQLKEAHIKLVSILQELESLSVSNLDERAVADARWRAARESGKRIQLIGSVIVPHLLTRASAAEARAIREFQNAGADLRTVISAHIGEWTRDRLVRDWAGYRQASSLIRASMLERIASERSLFYALLDLYPG